MTPGYDVVGSGRSPFDGWTLVHVGVGAVLGALGFQGDTVAGLAVAFEMLEPGLERWLQDNYGWEYKPESHGNSLVDAAAVWFGWWLVASQRAR